MVHERLVADTMLTNLIDCVRLYLEFSYAEDDRVFEAAGGKVVQLLDTDISGMYADPVKAAQYLGVFSDDGIARFAGVGIGIAYWLCSHSAPAKGFMDVHHAQEVKLRYLECFKNSRAVSKNLSESALKRMNSASDDLGQKASEIDALENLIANPADVGVWENINTFLGQAESKSPPASYIDWVHTIRWNMLFSGRPVRIFNAENLHAVSGLDYPSSTQLEPHALKWQDALRESIRLHERPGVVHAEAGKPATSQTSSKPRRNDLNDTQVLATVGELNGRAAQLGKSVRFVLATGAWRLERAAALCEARDSHVFKDSYPLRRPYCYFQHVIASDDKTSEEYDEIYRLLKGLLEENVVMSDLPPAECRLLVYGPTEGSAGPNYVNRSAGRRAGIIQSLRVLLEDERKQTALTDIVEKVRSRILLVGARRAAKDGERIKARISKTIGGSSENAERGHTVNLEKFVRAIEGIERERTHELIDVLVAGHFALNALNQVFTLPSRRPPMLRLSPYEDAHAYAAKLRQARTADDVFDPSWKSLRQKLLEVDSTRYTLSLVDALALAAVGFWDSALTMADRALRIAGDVVSKRGINQGDRGHPPTTQDLSREIEGEEAYYLQGFLRRYLASTVSAVKEASVSLGEAMRIKKSDPRFRSEKLAQDLQIQSIAAYGTDPNAVFLIDDLTSNLDQQLALESELIRLELRDTYDNGGKFPCERNQPEKCFWSQDEKQYVLNQVRANALMAGMMTIERGHELQENNRDRLANMSKQFAADVLKDPPASTFLFFVAACAETAFRNPTEIWWNSKKRDPFRGQIGTYLGRSDYAMKHDKQRGALLYQRFIAPLVTETAVSTERPPVH